jgi:hypothetical protein
MTPVAWRPPRDLSLAEWAEHGRRLGAVGRRAGWWIGDWLAYGNAAYGERYVRAARITGYDVQTLMNMVYVASHVHVSRRRETLSWSHHAEVVAVTEEEQELWLARAEQERMSVRDLRRAIQDERRGLRARVEEPVPSPEPESTAAHSARARREAPAEQYDLDDKASDHQVVCPSCGTQFLPRTSLTPLSHEG